MGIDFNNHSRNEALGCSLLDIKELFIFQQGLSFFLFLYLTFIYPGKSNENAFCRDILPYLFMVKRWQVQPQSLWPQSDSISGTGSYCLAQQHIDQLRISLFPDLRIQSSNLLVKKPSLNLTFVFIINQSVAALIQPAALQLPKNVFALLMPAQ